VLDELIRDGASALDGLDLPTMMRDIWEYHPRKVLGDILESVVGAVFVDSGYDLDVCDRFCEPIFREALNALKHAKMDDPVQRLIMWTCRVSLFGRPGRGSAGGDTSFELWNDQDRFGHTFFFPLFRYGDAKL
jgi:endoribonuclease Dicer